MPFRFDNGGDGCNGRAAAYGRTHTNKRFGPGRNAQPFPQYISRYESHDDSDQGDPERLQARLGHLLDAQAKTQRNNGPLQYLLGGKLQARLEYRPHTYGIAYGYTQQYSKYRPANYRHRSEETTSEIQSLMRISYAVFFLQQKH